MEEGQPSSNDQYDYRCHHEAAIWGVLLLSLFFAAAAFLGVTIIWMQNVALKSEMRELASELKAGQTYFLDKSVDSQTDQDKTSVDTDGEEVSGFGCEDGLQRYALPGSMREICVPNAFGVLSYEETASDKYEWRINFSESDVLGYVNPSDPSEIGDSGIPMDIDFECLDTLSEDGDIASCWLGAEQDEIESTSMFMSEGEGQSEVYEFSVRIYDIELDMVKEEPSTYFAIPSQEMLFRVGSGESPDATREMVRSL